MKNFFTILLILFAFGCSQTKDVGNSANVPSVNQNVSMQTNSETVKACYNDSECSPSQVCDCPSTSPTGNCDTAGVCKPRPEPASKDTEVKWNDNLDNCSLMTDLASIPPGYHPAQVSWGNGSPQGDNVCLERTEGKVIQVINWNFFPLPKNYHIIYQEIHGADPIFRGCYQVSPEWQGQRTCLSSWGRFQMRKNP